MFRRAEHPRAKDVRSGAPKPVSGGSFVPALPNTDAGPEVIASMLSGDTVIARRVTVAGFGQVCNTCGDIAVWRTEYGSPMWAQSHACGIHGA